MEVTRKRSGSAKLKRRKFNETARTNSRFHPSGFSEILTADRSRRIQAVGDETAAFWTWGCCLRSWAAWVKPIFLSFLFFSSFFLSLSSSSFSLHFRVRTRLSQGDSRVFQAPDQKDFAWRSVQEVPDFSVQVTEFRFCGFCSDSSQNSVKPKLTTLLHIYSW